jgi:hypothetical protein
VNWITHCNIQTLSLYCVVHRVYRESEPRQFDWLALICFAMLVDIPKLMRSVHISLEIIGGLAFAISTL